MTSLTQGSTTSDATTAIILLSRGAAYANGATELTALADRLHAALTVQGRAPLLVQPAFVDRSQPALPQALDLCAKAQTIIIVPVMVPDEPSLRRWLHKLIMRWRAHPMQSMEGAHCPRLVFAEPLLQTPYLADVLARTVEDALTQPDVPAVVDDDRWEHDPAGWSAVPEHQHHVLWCVGPRCAAKGSVQLWPQLVKTIRDTPGLKNSVMPLQTSCQFPCNHGPLMIVYPAGAWYGPLAEADIERVLTQHVRQGQVNEHLCVHGLASVTGVQQKSDA